MGTRRRDSTGWLKFLAYISLNQSNGQIILGKTSGRPSSVNGNTPLMEIGLIDRGKALLVQFEILKILSVLSMADER